MTSAILMIYDQNAETPAFAALGQVLRSLGRGWRAAIIQFSRGAASLGEVESVGLESALECHVLSEVANDGNEDAGIALAWEHARSVIQSGRFQLVLLDQLTEPLNRGLLKLDQVVSVLSARPPHVHVVITGHGFPASLLEDANLVTEEVHSIPPHGNTPTASENC
ncbi:MAG: cob(I)yrinic acid a,c-diamide adenosyltransferase [Thermodesulfobacteriota bacterium]